MLAFLNQRRNLILIFGLTLLLLASLVIYRNKSQASAQAAEKNSLAQPTASASLNKEYSFPLRNDNNKQVGTFSYILDQADVRSEIVVKGQKVTAVDNRSFLTITIKLKNDQDKPIQINAKDYLRLSLNGNQSEWLAPDIHNDPVQVQAISTKETRLGFPINLADTQMVLQVGEINGEKVTLPLELK